MEEIDDSANTAVVYIQKIVEILSLLNNVSSDHSLILIDKYHKYR